MQNVSSFEIPVHLVRPLSGFDLVGRRRRGRRSHRREYLVSHFRRALARFNEVRNLPPHPSRAQSASLCLCCGDVRVLFPCEDIGFLAPRYHQRPRGVKACKPEDLVIHWQEHEPLDPWCYRRGGCATWRTPARADARTTGRTR